MASKLEMDNSRWGATPLQPSKNRMMALGFSSGCPASLKDSLQDNPEAVLIPGRILATTADSELQVVSLPSGPEQWVVKRYIKSRLNPLRQQQVLRECSVHVGLDHPHIVGCYAYWETKAHVCILIEYLPDGDVFEIVRERGLPERRAAKRVVGPITLALAYLHEHGVCHRDVKLENVLKAKGTVKLADMGLSINLEDERPMTCVGTLDYMSPELLCSTIKEHPDEAKGQEAKYGTAVDIWALGVLTYECICARAPFEAKSRKQALEATRTTPIFPVEHFSADATDFIMKCLDINPEKRPTATELLEHPFLKQNAEFQMSMFRSQSRHRLRISVGPLDGGDRDRDSLIMATAGAGQSKPGSRNSGIARAKSGHAATFGSAFPAGASQQEQAKPRQLPASGGRAAAAAPAPTPAAAAAVGVAPPAPPKPQPPAPPAGPSAMSPRPRMAPPTTQSSKQLNALANLPGPSPSEASAGQPSAATRSAAATESSSMPPPATPRGRAKYTSDTLDAAGKPDGPGVKPLGRTASFLRNVVSMLRRGNDSRKIYAGDNPELFRGSSMPHPTNADTSSASTTPPPPAPASATVPVVTPAAAHPRRVSLPSERKARGSLETGGGQRVQFDMSSVPPSKGQAGAPPAGSAAGSQASTPPKAEEEGAAKEPSLYRSRRFFVSDGTMALQAVEVPAAPPAAPPPAQTSTAGARVSFAARISLSKRGASEKKLSTASKAAAPVPPAPPTARHAPPTKQRSEKSGTGRWTYYSPGLQPPGSSSAAGGPQAVGQANQASHLSQASNASHGSPAASSPALVPPSSSKAAQPGPMIRPPLSPPPVGVTQAGQSRPYALNQPKTSSDGGGANDVRPFQRPPLGAAKSLQMGALAAEDTRPRGPSGTKGMQG